MHETPITPPPGTHITRGGPTLVVPYVVGMLRAETAQAVAAWSGYSEMHPLDRADPYSYAKLMATVWNRGGDLLIVEHDMVPTPAQINGLLNCNGVWCSHLYHVGAKVYITGLGFAKFSASLQRDLPLAMQYASVHPARGGGLMPWQGVNEAVERTLTRRHIEQHVHDGVVTHLHYPEPADGA